MAGARECGVLGEESVARVDGVSTGPLCGVDDPLNGEIALRSLTGADVKRLIGVENVPRRTIAVRVHRDRAQAHLATRPDNPDGDLAAVGNENFHETRQAGAGRTTTGSGI